MHMYREIFEQPAVLQACMEKNAAAVREIAAAGGRIRNIVIAARGSSDHAGTYGKYMLEILTGVPVSLAACSVVTAYKTEMDYSGCLVVGLSQSGAAEDVAQVLARARACGALTVAVTNFPQSRVACAAAHHLCLYAGEEKSVAATKTVTAQMLLLYQLACALSGRDDLAAHAAAVPDKMRDTLACYGSIKDAASCFQFTDHCFILSRGVFYPMALEAALKLQETNYLNARALSTADFFHGPLAMVQKNTPVLFYAPTDACRPSALELGERLRELGAHVLLFDTDRSASHLAREVVVLPSIESALQPILYTAAAQMFACALTELKNLDPDQPRNIRKVTVTE